MSGSTEDSLPPGEELTGWFHLQLAFAHALADTGHCSFGSAVTGWTNLYRRCGFGSARKEPLNPHWQDYLDSLLDARDAAGEVRLTLQLMKGRFVPYAIHVTPYHEGCFAFDPPDEQGMVRLHFAPMDVDSTGGPLTAAKADRRRSELQRLFLRLRREFPDARCIRGTSWLYHLPAYRRLFPAEYIASSRIHTGPTLRYTGGSSWGQFLDHQGRLRQPQATRFLGNLASLNPQTLWKCFPQPAMIAEAPLTRFYHHFAIES